MLHVPTTTRARGLLKFLVVLSCAALVLSACGDDQTEEPTATAAPTTAAPDEAMPEEMPMMEPLGDGSLGVVEVEPGEAVQIRSLNAITGDVAFFGLPIERSVVLAIADYGQVHGFDVDMGTGLDDLCSNAGGQAAAQVVVADEDVIGVIGTSCSGAATAAAPLITDAGMVLISGGNTSPALTSDLAGTAGANYSYGYYRTAHNDLFQGRVMAEFVFNELGISTAAAIHDGDPYTQGLAKAFTDAFDALGGDVTGFSAVNKEDTDMVPVLTEIAAGSPGALFFPIFQPAGDFVAEQAPGVSGLEGTVLLAADGLLNTSYLALSQTEGMYFSGPDTRFGENVNASTGKSALDFLAAYERDYGEPPAAPFWAHGYDATTMLLDAISAASYVSEDGSLMVDRQGVREYLDNVRDYQGLIGLISCDDFGDCGSQLITVVHHQSADNPEATMGNVVYSGGGSGEGTMEPLGDGSLGVVEVEPGEAVQIRSLNAITGDVAFFGLPIERSVVLAIADYGQVHGFDVDMGTGLDDLCSNAGGQAAAQVVVADEDVIGVIGTSCSGAATAAAPLITDAGMVLISGGNTSPALTSDLAGTAGANYSYGYYRTAHNDLFQGRVMAEFVFNELGISTAAAIHDGDPYTQGLAKAFTDAFDALGGDVTGFSAVNKEDTDMVPVLTEIAAGSPGALFFPIFQPAGDFVAEQAPGVSGLEGTVLLAADGLLNTSYLALSQTEGMYFSGPDTRFGENVNASTGKSALDFLAAYERDYGEPPAAPFWAHGYDATTMLLDAISAASYVSEDGSLMVDRQGVREYLDNVRDYQGLIGLISCDDFGDCGSQLITVVHHESSDSPEASMGNVVYSGGGN